MTSIQFKKMYHFPKSSTDNRMGPTITIRMISKSLFIKTCMILSRLDLEQVHNMYLLLPLQLRKISETANLHSKSKTTFSLSIITEQKLLAYSLTQWILMLKSNKNVKRRTTTWWIRTLVKQIQQWCSIKDNTFVLRDITKLTQQK